MKCVVTLIILFAISTSTCSLAREEITDDVSILAYDIPSLLQSDKLGAYDKIIKQVIDIENKEWKYQVAPPARVDKMFDSKKVDCIIPFDKKFHSNKKTLNSTSLGIAEAYIFTTNTIIDHLYELKGKKVGLALGCFTDLSLRR